MKQETVTTQEIREAFERLCKNLAYAQKEDVTEQEVLEAFRRVCKHLKKENSAKASLSLFP